MSAVRELYRFVLDNVVYTYSSGTTWDVSYGGETYTPESITRSKMEQTQEINRANIKVALPRTNDIAAIYLATVPDWPASLTIYRQTGASTDTYWKGRIAGSSATGSVVELDCESAFTSLRRPGLRRKYEFKCDHALYHRGCRLDINDWLTSGLIDTNGGTTLVIPEAASQADGYFTNGIVRDPNGVTRWITSHVGDTITITRSFPDMDAAIAAAGYGLSYGIAYGGYSITLHPGCDRTKETCKDTFDNILNHGGCAWIPIKNPMAGSIT